MPVCAQTFHSLLLKLNNIATREGYSMLLAVWAPLFVVGWVWLFSAGVNSDLLSSHTGEASEIQRNTYTRVEFAGLQRYNEQ